MSTSVAKPLQETETSRRDIPSLDGLRSFSILLVIMAHSAWYFPAWVENSLPFRTIFGNGRHGVVVFFVISGYLITSLLMRERHRTGTISLKRFYFRRSFRIFPPFYVFIAAMAILWAMGVVPEHLPSFLAAATYTWTYYPFAHGYLVTHTWSLSIEEQFYLFWPLAFLFWHRRQKSLNLALALIVTMPFVRLAVYFAFPALRGHETYMLQGWIDAMMVGCLLALIKDQPEWKQWHRRYLNGWVAMALGVVGLFGVPYLAEVLPHNLGKSFALSIGPTITAFCIGGVLINVVDRPESPGGRVLNWAPIRHLGVISYSLYLWQQMFTSHQLKLLPYGFLYAIVAAELSFWLVERPSLRLRDRVERRMNFARVGGAVKTVGVS
jgi:peptidoglycan/LPS O-acetylase OafA/YrhL